MVLDNLQCLTRTPAPRNRQPTGSTGPLPTPHCQPVFPPVLPATGWGESDTLPCSRAPKTTAEEVGSGGYCYILGPAGQSKHEPKPEPSQLLSSAGWATERTGRCGNFTLVVRRKKRHKHQKKNPLCNAHTHTPSLANPTLSEGGDPPAPYSTAPPPPAVGGNIFTTVYPRGSPSGNEELPTQNSSSRAPCCACPRPGAEHRCRTMADVCISNRQRMRSDCLDTVNCTYYG